MPDIRDIMVDRDLDYEAAREVLADRADVDRKARRESVSDISEQVARAYRNGLSDGSEQGAALMAEHGSLAPFEHALLEDDVAHAPTRERRAYLLGRLRGFRDTTRIKRWGAWSL